MRTNQVLSLNVTLALVAILDALEDLFEFVHSSNALFKEGALKVLLGQTQLLLLVDLLHLRLFLVQAHERRHQADNQ